MRNLLLFSVSVALKRVVNPDPFSQYLTLFYKVLGAMNTSSLPSLLENARFAECSLQTDAKSYASFIVNMV